MNRVFWESFVLPGLAFWLVHLALEGNWWRVVWAALIAILVSTVVHELKTKPPAASLPEESK